MHDVGPQLVPRTSFIHTYIHNPCLGGVWRPSAYGLTHLSYHRNLIQQGNVGNALMPAAGGRDVLLPVVDICESF